MKHPHSTKLPNAGSAETTVTSAAGPMPGPISVQTEPASILTVGSGEMFQTLSAALAVASNGATILVNAGTYLDDFGTVRSNVSIIAVDGVANFVSDEPPSNDKGILTVDANVTVENCSFSGAYVSDADGGNGAGIRYEGGQMILENDSFVGNQDGILGFPSIAGLTNTVTIDHCLFQNNGSGSGYTHNVYIGAVSDLTFTNNVSEGAVVGHELKSRALVNDIENNVFMDGPSGTASYEIDLPNGGNDAVLNNYIEKGALAQNSTLVHFGGEGIPYVGSSLLVSGNSFENDYGAGAVAVLNQTSITVTISGNQLSGFSPGALVDGPGVATGNIDGNGVALPDQTLTGILPGNTLIITDSLSHSVSLDGSVAAVEGGAGLLTVVASVGHVVAIGGSGGLDFSETPGCGGNTITTLAGATDNIVVTGSDLIDSEGNDSLSFGAGNIVADLNGNSIVNDGTGSNQFSVGGTTSILCNGGLPVIAIAATANATISGSLGYLHVEDNGGGFAFNIVQGGAAEALTGAGGLDVQVYGGAINVSTSSGPAGATLHFGAGAATVTSVGADTIYAGSGPETLILEGAANVFAGTGSLTVFGRSDTAGARVYGDGGTYTFAGDTGNIAYFGGSCASVVNALLGNMTLTGGSGHLTVLGGSDETITGGSGGLVYSATDGGGGNTICTASGARDLLNLVSGDTVNSYGNDTINAGSGNQIISVFGNTTLNGSTGASFLSFSGTDILNAVGYDRCTVSSGANLTVNAGSLTLVAETDARIRFNIRGLQGASATVVGGAATLSGGNSSNPAISISTAQGTSTTLTLSNGTANVSANGADIVHASAGTDIVCISCAPTTIYGGVGTLTVINADNSSSDTQTVFGGRGATSYTQSGGALNFIGGAGSTAIDGGSGQLFVIGGTGALTIVGGEAGEQIIAGSGALKASLSFGGSSIEFGSGSSSVQEAPWGAADMFQFVAGHGGGTDTIVGFRLGTDSLTLSGVRVKSEALTSTGTKLTLTDNTHVLLANVTDTTHLFLGH